MFYQNIGSDFKMVSLCDLHTNIHIIKMKAIKGNIIKADLLKETFSDREKEPIHSHYRSILSLPVKNCEKIAGP